MHQMRISTTQVSSVMLSLKELEIQKKKKKRWKLLEPLDENQTECHEIEPNLIELELWELRIKLWESNEET